MLSVMSDEDSGYRGAAGVLFSVVSEFL